MYTSGTTGDPKGVLISNKSIITIVSAVDEFLRISGEEVGYLSIVFYFNVVYPNNALSLPFTKSYFDPTASRGWCLHILPSACSYLWPGDWGGVHSPWCFNWILAWGKYRKHMMFYTQYLSQVNLIASILFQDVKLLVEDIGELKPTVFCAVPRVLDRIYGGTLIELNISFSNKPTERKADTWTFN